jgi:hypothetical protein
MSFYNITNANATVTTMVPTTAVGILLAPNNNINTMDSASFTGEVIGGYRHTIILMSGTKVTNPCHLLQHLRLSSPSSANSATDPTLTR